MCVKTDKHLTIDGFRPSLDGLDKSNRWVWLGNHLPCNEYEKLYGQTLNNQTAGASAKPAHMMKGAISHTQHLPWVISVGNVRSPS
ncbi:MAG: hypothetical protein J6Z14_01580 [Prevotella sp.]|nr:hypothetical protein [Prevotella sp.]